MPDGGVVALETANVRLDEAFSATSNVEPGDYVLITISDIGTGTGIPPEIIDHVFKPFFTTNKKGKGTGLGLSTVFGFVKQSSPTSAFTLKWTAARPCVCTCPAPSKPRHRRKAAPTRRASKAAMN